MDTKAVLAKNMKAARDRLGISQAKLAELAETSVAFIGEIEIGRKSPSLENLGKIAHALGLEVYQLLLTEAPTEVAERQTLLTDLKKDLSDKIHRDIDETIRDYLTR
ncbi:helix-turn-helix transcriptional regulator [Treponema zuelzerae]|uniref:Helix-turn-helix transcriptional regulator n=1 Tax=Teretinema zuelzerae TaxID=156 RepID=A0AAE3JM94_9SPIR|nr:helix-turn-helix transcriptional regulator [Teretinema zuelzerae]MCD1655514.1 helix-turn-helix transcriptional regulator [Teretinema zuelzerae]